MSRRAFSSVSWFAAPVAPVSIFVKRTLHHRPHHTHERTLSTDSAGLPGRTTFVNTLCGKKVLYPKDADDAANAHLEEGVRIKPVTVGEPHTVPQECRSTF